MDRDVIAEKTGLSKRKVISILNRLQEVGAAVMTESGTLRFNSGISAARASDLVGGVQDRMQEAKRERIGQMQQYAEISTCRREYLLNYFGDSFTGPCNNCDNDNSVDAVAGSRREV